MDKPAGGAAMPLLCPIAITLIASCIRAVFPGLIALTLLLCLARPVLADHYDFTTIAGAPGGVGSSDGKGSAARFNHPRSVAVDGEGNLFVADTNNHTIRKITPDGIVTTFAGSAGDGGSADGPRGIARLNFPLGVAVDGNANVFVVGNGAIRKITVDGVVTTLPGRVVGERIAVDRSGNVFVAFGDFTIRKIAVDGVVTTLAGSAGMFGHVDGTGSAARFDGLESLAVDGSGNIYAAQGSGNVGTIRKITAAGVVTTLANLGGSIPRGVAVDRDGNVFVNFGWSPTILKITVDGIVSPITFDTSSGAFAQPAGIAVDANGNIFVADSGNHNIRKISAGVVTTFAGGASFGSTDGPGRVARFNQPRGVAVDGHGNLFVTDAYNHSVRKITASGFVSTLADSASLLPDADPFAWVDLHGLAADTRGNVFVAAYYDGSGWLLPDGSTIRRITADGIVTRFAGSAVDIGSTDGAATAARFNVPRGVAADSIGNVFVADSSNHTIRKIAPDGLVSTLAGLAKHPGSSNGAADAARFNLPGGVATDSLGNVLVADSGNHTIRKISAAGVVTTLAGSTGNPGSVDGPGPAARFHSPRGVAIDEIGNVFVADTSNHTIRRITPAGLVTTVAGLAGSPGDADGAGGAVRFHSPTGVAVDAKGNLFVADSGNNIIRRGTPGSPAIGTQPLSQTIARGRTAMLSVTTIGSSAPSYQWIKDGFALPGATDATLVLSNVSAATAGTYQCVVTTAGGSVTSLPALISVVATVDAGRFNNFSLRASLEAGRSIVAGFVLDGPGQKTLLIRGIGPALGAFGVSDALPDPRLEIFRSSGPRLAENDDWPAGLAGAFASTGAFVFPAGSKDAALVLALPPGAYTAVLSGVGGTSGEALVEIYEVP